MKNGWYATTFNATNLKNTINSHIVNFYYKDGEWFDHSACYEDSRCSGYVNKCCKVIGRLENDNAALIKKLNHIGSMCGNPDPVEACRLILKKVKE